MLSSRYINSGVFEQKKEKWGDRKRKRVRRRGEEESVRYYEGITLC